MAAEDDTSLPQPSQSTPIIPRSYQHLKQLRESNTPVKMSWPGLEGLTVEEAEKRIKEEMPNVQIQVVKPAHCITCDYRLDRVRLYVDKSGKVVEAPKLG